MEAPSAEPVTRKKPVYPISPELRAYLSDYQREVPLPISYDRLLHWSNSVPLLNNDGEDTLWETVYYERDEWKELNEQLTRLYSLMRAEGDSSVVGHLYADRVDYCAFGNTNPFRIRIVNAHNDNQDYYYIKRGDASRVYGLELEHLLSPNRIHYFTHEETLVEEHVPGIPGDVFVERWLNDPNLRKVRVAKELVKFNERCFVRLLGDMRAYNFVVQLTPDFEGVQVRIRAMDFDQQSYSGRLNFYRPQFFKDNVELVNFCTAHLHVAAARQYQKEEHAVIHRRMTLVAARLGALFSCMRRDLISTPQKVTTLKESLAQYWQNTRFLAANCMGDLVLESLEHIRRPFVKS